MISTMSQDELRHELERLIGRSEHSIYTLSEKLGYAKNFLWRKLHGKRPVRVADIYALRWLIYSEISSSFYEEMIKD